MADKILVVTDKKENRFLRKKTVAFNFAKHSKEEIRTLIQRMKKTMQEANGIGLSANQIGLLHRVFIAYLPAEDGGYKFYSIFNPIIEKPSKATIPFEEGCLSIPGIYGTVERSDRLTLTGSDKHGKPIKIKAWGLLARVFQHEMDHLNGYVFTDRTKILHSIEEMKKRNAS
jgi:peptide deformylase